MGGVVDGLAHIGQMPQHIKAPMCLHAFEGLLQIAAEICRRIPCPVFREIGIEVPHLVDRANDEIVGI